MSGAVPAERARQRIAMYWAAGCGGCDMSLLEIGPHLLELVDAADVVFWPCLADFKYRDVAGYPDGHIDVCFVNGAVRNSEEEEIARLLRRKSRTLVAYGACAVEGGVPALASLGVVEALFDAVYRHNPSIDNPDGVLPRTRTETPHGALSLPSFYRQVLRLRDVVEVDYQIPGCPPQAPQVWSVVQAVLNGGVPAKGDGRKVGCDDKSVCDTCAREKRQVRISGFKRPHEVVPEPGWCLLEQGFLCMGPATRGGCGALCLKANLPCRGCYGPAGNAEDQGMAMIGALGSILDATTEERARELVAQVVDPVGTFYRFSLSSSHLKGGRAEGRGGA
jgi:F420-non-reducing hydrogenase small subunit